MVFTLVTSVTGLLVSAEIDFTQPHILNIYKDFQAIFQHQEVVISVRQEVDRRLVEKRRLSDGGASLRAARRADGASILLR